MEQNGTIPSDKILDLIKKCLALSESPNEHEASLAMAKAQELLEKYNLSMAQVQQKSEQDDISQLIDCIVPTDSESWERMLCERVAELNFCKVIGHPYAKNISVIGRMINVQSTIEMTQWLQQQIERYCLDAVSENNKLFQKWNLSGTGSVQNYNKESKRSFKLSFYLGCVNRISERLKELQDERQGLNINLRALVVSLGTETSNYVRELYPILGQRRRVSASSANGYQSGIRAGDKVSIVRPSSHIEGGPMRLNGGY
jgi:hypothetical protein